MKRSLEPHSTTSHNMIKKLKHDQEEIEQEQEREEVEAEAETSSTGSSSSSGLVNLDENLLFEVLKHVDAKSLAASACVSRLWQRTARDERLWELICTKHWANIGCGNHQLRFVVLALGGFRRLHSLYIWPLSNPQSSTSAPPSAWPAIASPKPPAAATRWGKDEVHLSLSLLSIRFYEKMTSTARNTR